MKISFYQQRNAKRVYYLPMAFRDPRNQIKPNQPFIL